MKVLDTLMVFLPLILILIALLLACALRIVCRGTACRSSLSAVADDPFFFPFGEMPTVPGESDWLIHIPGDRVSLVYGLGVRARNVRMHDASDFRAWGIPLRSTSAAVAHRRIASDESGGRPKSHSLSGTAVVLNFPGQKLDPSDVARLRESWDAFQKGEGAHGVRFLVPGSRETGDA